MMLIGPFEALVSKVSVFVLDGGARYMPVIFTDPAMMLESTALGPPTSEVDDELSDKAPVPSDRFPPK